MPKILGGSYEIGRFLVSEVPMYSTTPITAQTLDPKAVPDPQGVNQVLMLVVLSSLLSPGQIPHTLHLIPYTPHPEPHTLHPPPFALHPTPSLHPTP